MVIRQKEMENFLNNSQTVFKTVAVRELLFLITRKMAPDIGSLLVSLNTGLIQVWSHHRFGGYLTAFTANHVDRDCCLCMATDPLNRFLITGNDKNFFDSFFFCPIASF